MTDMVPIGVYRPSSLMGERLCPETLACERVRLNGMSCGKANVSKKPKVKVNVSNMKRYETPLKERVEIMLYAIHSFLAPVCVIHPCNSIKAFIAVKVQRHICGVLVLSYSRVVQIRLMESPSRNDVSQLSEIATYTEPGAE
jgi:hypothetical protein